MSYSVAKLDAYTETGTGALMLNATTQGEAPNAWLAANWRMSF